MVINKKLNNGYSHQDPVKALADASTLLNSEHIFSSITTILLIGGLLLIAFSKERIEDEQILQLRFSSLQWAIYCDYFVIMISVLFTSSIHFRDFVVLNLWTPLIFFIIRFRWKMYMNKRLLRKEA